MKCLRVSGTEKLIDEFLLIFCTALEGRAVCIARENDEGGYHLSFPGSSFLEAIHSIPPDIVLVCSDTELSAPLVHCAAEPGTSDSLLIGRFDGNTLSPKPEELFDRTFNLLPQKTVSECGRCGMDCRRMAESILSGERDERDCYYSHGNIEVRLGGRPVELGEFPASIVEGAVRGLVSSLKGYSIGKDISIEIRS
jgi:hypothetical protein